MSTKHASKCSTKKHCGKPKHKIDFVPNINLDYTKEDLKTGLTNAVSHKEPFTNGDDTILHSEPFTVGCLPNFVQPEQFMEHLKEELADQIFCEKNNDLYKFQQTDDFKKISSPYAKEMRKFLCDKVHKWLCQVTGLDLDDKVDSTCSRYDYTDVLLCHDDELDTRRIAFVFYLVPTWKKADGGCLDLYNMDEHLQPKEVVKSIVPVFNQFIWFEVTEASHHQVAEVLCPFKSRLSVNGWFHTKPIPRQPRYIEPRTNLEQWENIEEDVFYDWINPIYMDPEVQSQIQEKFENDSEIELQGFLQEEKYQALLQALKSPTINWNETGPPNKRHYRRIDPNGKNDTVQSASNDTCDDEHELPKIILECQRFLKSEMMFLTLSNLTGLSLHPLACNNDSSDDGDNDENQNEDTDNCDNDSENKVEEGDIKNEVSTENKNGDCDADSDTVVQEKQPGTPSKRNRAEASTSDSTANGGLNGTNKSRSKHKRRKLEDNECDKGDAKVEFTETSSADVDCRSSEPKCTAEIRKWQHGDYTLIHDTDTDGMEYALDAMLFCSCKGWKEAFGGFTSYISKGEDEELLTVMPTENSLALVYRDKETLRFVKHINDHVMQSAEIESPEFYDFSLVYYE